MVGVSPCGAQVRLSGETRQNPVSSSKMSVARHARHFFYLGPDVLAPLRDRLVVAAKRPALRPLATPTQSAQDVPDPAGVIADGKQLPNQVRDAVESPVIARITLGEGPAFQFSLQPA